MTDFIYKTTDKLLLAGITWAREQGNASLSLSEGQALEDHPDYVATDEAYFTARMNDVAVSYATQAGYNEVELVKKEQAVAAERVALDAVKA